MVTQVVLGVRLDACGTAQAGDQGVTPDRNPAGCIAGALRPAGTADTCSTVRARG